MSLSFSNINLILNFKFEKRGLIYVLTWLFVHVAHSNCAWNTNVWKRKRKTFIFTPSNGFNIDVAWMSLGGGKIVNHPFVGILLRSNSLLACLGFHFSFWMPKVGPFLTNCFHGKTKKDSLRFVYVICKKS